MRLLRRMGRGCIQLKGLVVSLNFHASHEQWHRQVYEFNKCISEMFFCNSSSCPVCVCVCVCTIERWG